MTLAIVGAIALAVLGGTPASSSWCDLAIASACRRQGAAARAADPLLRSRQGAAARQRAAIRGWHASPILVSGASAYRKGEFLYQGYLYDDHGAKEVTDPGNPMHSPGGDASGGDLFSAPTGTYDYPSGPGYDENAADLVELRVKPQTTTTAFRITLNTLEDPSLVARRSRSAAPKGSPPVPVRRQRERARAAVPHGPRRNGDAHRRRAAGADRSRRRRRASASTANAAR